MKGYFGKELQVGFNRKMLIVLLLAIAFSLSLSAYHSFHYAQNLRSMREMRIVETENQLMTDESNVSVYESIGGTELVELMEKRRTLFINILEGYRSGDMMLVLKNQVEDYELQLRAKEHGLKIDPDSEKDLADRAELNQLLIAQNIAPYDPLLESHDGVSSLLFFLKNIMLYLVPFVVMLICSDSISTEIHSGSIKLLLVFPCSRAAILRSKYFALFTQSTLIILGSLVGTLVGGMLFSGIGDFRYPVKAQESFFVQGMEAYVPSWILLIRALSVLICAVLFFVALALLFSVLIKNNIASLAIGTLVSVGAVFLSRKAVTMGQGGWVRYLPFELSDSYAASLGKIVVPVETQVVDTSGLIAMGNTGQVVEIANSFPGIVPCMLLLAAAVVCLLITVGVFSKRDVA